jgi:hypothetical protein
MDKPRSTLFLPAGTLAEMRPFRRWLAELPTYRIAFAEAGESCDTVEINPCVCPDHLIRSLERLVSAHAPYHLVLNRPVPERSTGALHIRATERGVLVRDTQWREVSPVTRQQWLESVAARGARRPFSLQTVLFPGLVSLPV